MDQIANRVITTSDIDLKSTVVNATTNVVVGTIPSSQDTFRIAVNTSSHRAYVSGGVGLVQAIDLATGTLVATIPTGGEMAFPIVNTSTHVAYVPRTTLTTGVAIFNQTGEIGMVSGIPHGDGRFLFGARNATTNRVYVANLSASAAGGSEALPGYVAVIDGATNASIANVPAGNIPFGIGINEVTNKIYVGNSNDGPSFPGGLTIINGADNSTSTADVSQIPFSSGFQPGLISVQRDIVPNPATNKVYFRITGGSTTTIGVLDGATNVATPLPASLGPVNIIRANPTLNRIYVGGQVTGQPNQVHVLNGANDQEIATLTVGSPSIFIGTQSYLAVNQTTGKVYIADFNQDTLAVVDGTTNTIVATLAVGDGPSTVAVNEASNRIYVGNANDKTLTIVNGSTLRVEATLALPLAPVRLAVDEAVLRIYALSSTPDSGIMVIADAINANGPLTITSVTQGASGSVTVNANGSVTYTPNSGFAGADSFTYTVTDGNGGTSTGTVNVTTEAALTITTATMPSSTVGQSYSQTLAATGGSGSPPAYVWSLASGQLPGGLSLNPTTGAITGVNDRLGYVHLHRACEGFAGVQRPHRHA